MRGKMRKKILSILFVVLSVAAIGIINVHADGAADYATYCPMCHGPLASSTVKGTTVAAVRAAVTAYGMGNTGSLSDAQIQAILNAIHGTPTPTPTPAPTPTPTPSPMPSGMRAPSGKMVFPHPPVQAPVTNNDPLRPCLSVSG
ncbi:exported hypothetical protein [Candidatus Sulfobium mesophilum]|uniref:Cytochrome c domain-containing protein n=1 Tax=Candidatus Sulfobium mesophilum TaxID=2016548 RepID=A0A2U3QL75_9BACT|nr:exported hypothetical protein [Candidatus Sulfobium mesophilum]